MKLSKSQALFYQENGYLIVENLFSEAEINKLKSATKIFEDLKSSPNVICEDNGEIRSVFAPQEHEASFEWLYKERRLIEIVEQLVHNKVYLYQYKLNNKMALKGKAWEWHQDFPYWHLDDGVETPNLVSAMILFQNTNTYQGPLLLLPGSHKYGVVNFQDKAHLKNGKANLLNSLNADLKYTVHSDFLKDYFTNNNIIEAVGPTGTCIFFHPNLFHASTSNISPFDRKTAIITYNDVANKPKKETEKRPEYICSRNFEPIEY